MARPLATVLALLGIACHPGGDLTVPPPPAAPAEVDLDVPRPRDDGRLPSEQRPLGYHLELEVDPRAERFRGEVRIDVELDRPQRALVLHANGLTIERSDLRIGEERVAVTTTSRASAGNRDSEDELVVVAPDELPAGTVTLQLAFSGPLEESLRGLYRVTEGADRYVFTQFEPADARRAFPCFDDPVYKVPFDLAVTAPAEDEVFANTREQSRTRTSDGRVRHVFARTEPLPTYLVAFAIGRLAVLEGAREPVPLRVVARPGREQLGATALEVAREQLELLAAYFERPYPYDKLDLVAVPNFGAGAMENAGLVTFREELLLLDDATASSENRRDVATILAHELAHQWFGNLVTMRWWDDLWLNEGFATHVEASIVDRWKPELGAGLDLLVLGGRVMDLDALPSARKVRQPVANTHQAEEAFDGITYIKGARVLGMVEQWLGPETFRKGIATYLDRHAFAHGTASDLFAALTTASRKDVAQVASSFVDQTGLPLVRATLSCGRDEAPSITLTQQPYAIRPGRAASTAQWSIPVCLRYGTSDDLEAAQQSCALLDRSSVEVPLDTSRCPTWVWPNDRHAGYYRYALDTDGLDALAAVARAGPPAMRVGFVSNAWSLVQAGEVPARWLLEELRRYRGDQPWVVVDQLVEVFERVDDALVVDRSREAFERLVTASFLPAAKRLGWASRETDPEAHRMLRPRLLDALSVLTDEPWVARNAQRLALSYLDAPSSVDRDLAAVAVPRAAHQGAVTFDQLRSALDRMEGSQDRVIVVRGLAALRGEDLDRTLGLVLDGTIRAQDSVYVAREAIRWRDNRAHLVAWLEEHVDAVAERLPGFALARMVAGIRRICAPELRARAAERLSEPLSRRGTSRRLQEALDAADACIDLRERQLADVTTYLEKSKR